MQNMSDAMLAVLKARENIAAKHVFFQSTIYFVELVEDNSIPTMCTNGTQIRFSPKYVAEKPQDTEFTLFHEFVHCLLEHVFRREGRDPYRWNIACDHKVNALARYYYTVPDNCYCDLKYDPDSAEMVYDLLPEQAKNQPKPQKQNQPDTAKPDDDATAGQGNQPDDESQDGNDPQSGSKPDKVDGAGNGADESDTSETQPGNGDGKWESAPMLEPEKDATPLSQAIERALSKGNVPGAIRKALEVERRKPEMPWRTLLRKMAYERKTKQSSTWSHTNRRRPDMPGHRNDTVNRIVVCLDTSGSVNIEANAEMLAEIAGMMEQGYITHATLISTDTKICNMQDVSQAQQVREFDLGNCRGGTDFEIAMKVVAQAKNTAGCVFLTDMQTNSFGDKPPMPVLWVDWTNSGAQAPYGRTVPKN